MRQTPLDRLHIASIKDDGRPSFVPIPTSCQKDKTRCLKPTTSSVIRLLFLESAPKSRRDSANPTNGSGEFDTFPGNNGRRGQVVYKKASMKPCLLALETCELMALASLGVFAYNIPSLRAFKAPAPGRHTR